MTTLLDRLRAETHLLRVEEPRYKRRDLPKVDYSLFPQDNMNDAKSSVKGLENYLCETYLFYDNLSDATRDDVEMRLINKYGAKYIKIYERGRLKVKRLAPVLSNIEYLADDLIRPNERISEIATEMRERFFGKYETMTNEQRLQFSEDLMSRVYEVLQLLSRKSPPK